MQTFPERACALTHATFDTAPRQSAGAFVFPRLYLQKLLQRSREKVSTGCRQSLERWSFRGYAGTEGGAESYAWRWAWTQDRAPAASCWAPSRPICATEGKRSPPSVALGPRASQAASLAGLWSTPSLSFPLSPRSLSSTVPFTPLTTHRRFCCLQMGRTLAVSLVDCHQVCSATEWSGFFRIAERYREVNVAHNEGHAAAVRTGHTRQWCACPPRGGSEEVGVPGVIAGKFTVTPTRRSSPICS